MAGNWNCVMASRGSYNNKRPGPYKAGCWGVVTSHEDDGQRWFWHKSAALKWLRLQSINGRAVTRKIRPGFYEVKNGPNSYINRRTYYVGTEAELRAEGWSWEGFVYEDYDRDHIMTTARQRGTEGSAKP
jgi:hypothetical protein